MDDDTEDGFGDLASGIEEDNFYAFLNISKDVRFAVPVVPGWS